jgi:hypothetical protein
MRTGFSLLCFLATLAPGVAGATSSAELYTSSAYGYGRFEARVRFAAGDGVVSSFFLWKDGSEQPGTFWNELDDEKVGADCHLTTTAYYGNPAVAHSESPAVSGDLCGAYHTYAYEWTPDAIVWFVDGTEIRRETGATAQAYADNAAAGMQIHFNVWPGDASFGGNFSASILPVFEYVDWVQYSSYANGTFTLAWREDFTSAALPSGWLTGNWASAKNLSTHSAQNVNFVNGYAVLSLTADDATGAAGADPGPPDGSGGMGSGGANAGGAGPAGSGSGGAASGATSAGGAGSGATASSGAGSGAAGAAGAAAGVGGSNASTAGAGMGGMLTVGGADGGGGAAPSGGAASSSGGTSGAQSTSGASGSGDSAASESASTSDRSGGCNLSNRTGRYPFVALAAIVLATLARGRGRHPRRIRTASRTR